MIWIRKIIEFITLYKNTSDNKISKNNEIII